MAKKIIEETKPLDNTKKEAVKAPQVVKKTTTARKTKPKDDLKAPIKLKILVTIVDRKKVDFYMSALETHQVNMQTVMYAKGTAPKEILNQLGLTPEKAVIFSVVREDKIKEILIDYEDKYFKTKNGKGIAFTVPIKSLIGVLIYQFLADIEV